MADIESLKRELEEIKAALKTLTPGSRAHQNLEKERAALEVQLTGAGAIAQGDGAKAVGKGGILIEGDFNGNIYQGEDPAEDKKRLVIYRRWVAQATSNLPLRSVDVGASDPTSGQQFINLANIYIGLDTTTPWLHAQGAGIKNAFGSRSLPQKQERMYPVLQAVSQNRHSVLLGDPGSGKSTFVNFLAHCLAAHVLESGKNCLAYLEGWDAAEANILPVVVLLRDFARHYAEKLPVKAEPSHLLDFIAARLKAQNLAFAQSVLEKAFDAGESIVLLDGLDEVPTQEQRLFVRNAVRAFIGRYEKSRFLITCRVLSYQPPSNGRLDLRLNELPCFEIAPFDQNKINQFVSAWYAELGRMGTIPNEDVSVYASRLHEAVQRPDLQRLAPNPLLLTVMSLVHTHRGRLPDARTLLYEETVDILLWRWEQVKLSGEEESPKLRQYLLEASRTDVDLKRALWQLAYEAQEASQPDESGETLADIPEQRILTVFSDLKYVEEIDSGDLGWAKRVISLMKTRAGLLLERQPEIFTFPHRTFQEYLAGAHLAAQANFSQLVSELAYKNVQLWREVILYAVGKLVYVNGDIDKSLALVAELCPEDTSDGDTSWRLVWLASDILQEIGLHRVCDGKFGRDLLKRTKVRLQNLLEAGKLAPRERVHAGNSLALLGDPRFDAKTWYLPKGPTLGFIYIPEGKFIMGSDDKTDRYYRDSELPKHELYLPEFWLAKYPVTVAQYKLFIESSGYKTSDRDSLSGISNHPVVWVNWYDALAYCNWLDEQLKEWAKQNAENGDLITENGRPSLVSGLLEGRLSVTLPSEAEWEKAARGQDGRLYPWGNKSEIKNAITFETGIGDVSPVGAFPDGKSPYNLLDMGGNIAEWTRSLWGKSSTIPEFNYPYEPGGKHENLEAGKNTLRVLRGGSSQHDIGKARCAYRYRSLPSGKDKINGFRVAVSHITASDE